MLQLPPSLHPGSKVRIIVAGALCAILFLILSLHTHISPSVRHTVGGWKHRPPKGTYDVYDSVANSTLGFERIFVINLPERTDKKDAMILQAAVSGLKFDFADGVKVESIKEKALPIIHQAKYKETWVAAWRAHANVLSQIIHQNLSSALIMEDDIDWDISLKDILRDIARSTSAISNDPSAMKMDLRDLSSTGHTQISPYGDDWDVLWLGHCGSQISTERSHVLKFDDPTVPQPHHLHSWDPNEVTPLAIYPNHTRLVGHFEDGVCSLAYAVSQSGARKLLYDIGILHLDMGFDLMLRSFCNGSYGRKKHKCYGVLPPAFEHYRRAGLTSADSDLHDLSREIREQGFTMNLRHTVALNMDQLLAGSTDYRDQFPDT